MPSRRESLTSMRTRRDTRWCEVFFNSVLAMWSRAYLHSGVLNGVTTGLGGVKRRFAGAQRSSSHILHARNHMIEVFVRSPTSSFQRVSFPSLTMLSERGCTSVRSIQLTRRSKHGSQLVSRSEHRCAEARSKDLQSPEWGLI